MATIRPALREDVPLLLKMMQATASEQNAAQAVTATKAGLLDALGFDQLHANDAGNRIATHNAKALLVEAPEGEVAGMVFYYTTFDPWVAKSGLCLEGLHVLPGYRCREYARILVRAVAKKAEELGCARVEPGMALSEAERACFEILP